MHLDPTPRYPRGFSGTSAHVGIKADGPDLTLIVSEVPAAAAAVFTRNQIPGAPIVVGRDRIRSGRLQALVINSRVANVGRGEEGIERALRMGEAAAAEVGCDPALVLVSSTGIIGAPLPIEKIERGLSGMADRLTDDPLVAARGIMTTDSYPKSFSLPVAGGRLTAIAKGSGMIAPNMATLLVYLLTDLRIDAEALDRHLRTVVDDTLNMLSVDGDTSTSDTCALLANGLAGPVASGEFEVALRHLLEVVTEALARDGEGATRMLRVRIEGAEDRAAARALARSVVESPLIKTMVHGGDPNVGRILMAVGKVTSTVIQATSVDAWVGTVQVVRRGRPADFSPDRVRALLTQDPVDLRIAVGNGDGTTRAWGCDLSRGYIDENGAYTST